MITYKHEAFISEAIHGVLMQKTAFEVELIIADDCSPDNTEAIVMEIIKTHPNGHWIKYFRHQKNIGMQANGVFANENCSGKYVAICEGDDYWTDPLKLQKQVDLIEKNPNCNIVYHNCMVVDQYGNDLRLVYSKDYNKELNFFDLLIGEYTKTCTVLLRNGLINKDTKIADDTVIFMEALEDGGTAMFITDVMSKYRIHQGGVWSLKSNVSRFIESEILENYLYSKYKPLYPTQIHLRMVDFYYNQSIQLSLSHFYKLSAYSFLKYLKLDVSLIAKCRNFIKYCKYFLVSLAKRE